MNLLSAPVLGIAGVLVAPALWAALIDGSMPVDVALTRYLVAVLACWVSLSVVAALVMAGPPAQRGETPVTAGPATPEAAPETADAVDGA